MEVTVVVAVTVVWSVEGVCVNERVEVVVVVTVRWLRLVIVLMPVLALK